MLNTATIDKLKESIRGELVAPNDEGYESARKVYNAMIDKRPQLIVRCSDVADVMAAVNSARENGWLLAVRGGGHNGAGLGVCDEGLVIDLARLKGVRVDPESRLVRVEGGATWGDVDHATHAFGLAVPAGVISTTGVGGLTLGGATLHECDKIPVDPPKGPQGLIRRGNERRPARSPRFLRRIVEGGQITKHRRGRRKSSTALLAPAPLQSPPLPPGHPVVFDLTHDPAQTVIGFQSIDIGDTVAAGQVQKDQGHHHLMVAPALASLAPDLQMPADR